MPRAQRRELCRTTTSYMLLAAHLILDDYMCITTRKKINKILENLHEKKRKQFSCLWFTLAF
jgi:hypothetical protein